MRLEAIATSNKKLLVLTSLHYSAAPLVRVALVETWASPAHPAAETSPRAWRERAATAAPGSQNERRKG